jgi:hypothetical protein
VNKTRNLIHTLQAGSKVAAAKHTHCRQFLMKGKPAKMFFGTGAIQECGGFVPKAESGSWGSRAERVRHHASPDRLAIGQEMAARQAFHLYQSKA